MTSVWQFGLFAPLAPAQRGPDARRRPRAAREAYSLYVERAAEGANEAYGPFSAAARSSGPAAPDDQEQRAEGDGVNVVLGHAGLDAAQPVADAQRPRAQEVHDAVHEVAVDPADDPRDAEDDVAVDAGEQVVEPEALEGGVADHAEGAGQ